MTTKAFTKQLLDAVAAASLLVLGALVLSLHDDAFAAGFTPRSQQAWQRLTASEDNFSVLMPVQPEIRGRGEFTWGPYGQPVKSERIASAYHNGVVYVIRLYDVSNPKKLLSEFVKDFNLSDAEESTATVGSIDGKQYLKRGDGFLSVFRLYPTKYRLYILQAAARSEANPDVKRFMSSLTLGGVSAAAASRVPDAATTQSADDASTPLAPAGTMPLSEKEVTLPAVIVDKPQPPYLPVARQHRVSGKVKLRVVLSQSGEVTGVEVIKGLAGGLTDEAIKVAKSIKFLPAEKDGRLVPQYAEVEYNFVLM